MEVVNFMKKFFCLFLSVLVLFSVAGCSYSDDASPIRTITPQPEKPDLQAAELGKQENKVNVEITMKDGGVMKLELYPDIAPITVANFVKLAEEGFYDGLTFHRIIKGFMIQGGDPEGTGMGGSDENIKGEFSANGVENNISHKRGVISMARSKENDSASSQFFIVHEDSLHLDGQYAGFGMMTEGFDVLDAIADNTTVEDANGTVSPANQPVIKTIKIVK